MRELDFLPESYRQSLSRRRFIARLAAISFTATVIALWLIGR